MPARSIPRTFRARGLSDAIDATNAFHGAMAVLQNLVPDPRTEGVWLPRPACIGLAGSGSAPTQWGNFNWGGANWGGFGTVSGGAQINALLVVGDLVYGMIASTSGTYNGKDVPFCYNLATQAFLTISIPGSAAALPTTPSTTGDWTPPTMSQVAGRILVTHPGFAGGSNPFFGWLDVSGFTDTSQTGSTHSSKTIDTLSNDVLTAGWQVGMTITGSGIPADTTVTSIAANGLSITISQAATASATGVALSVAGGTAAAPLWSSGNTNGTALPAVPVAVFNFNARAYFAVPGNGAYFSDSGVPCQITNATQALSTKNGLDITAWGGLPYSQTSGGPLQALIGFQGDAGMISITGDAAASNLAVNNLGFGVGTLAPNTIANTPLGLTFTAPDGVRYVSFLQTVSDPIGTGGRGVVYPFLNAINPSRMAAAYNQDVYRVSVQNGAVNGQPLQEYWYYVSRKIWSGPHTFPASVIQPYQGSPSHGFILVSPTVLATLWQSQVVPTSSASYVENNAPMAWVWQPCLMPDNQLGTENAIIEGTLAMDLPPGSSVQVTATNEAGQQIDTLAINGPAGAATVWDSFLWGQALWGGSQGFLRQYDIPWSTTLVFKQMTLQVNGFSFAGQAVGNYYYRYEPLSYRMQAMSGVAVAGGQI